MFLDLASTIAGGVLVLVGEGVLLVVVMVWALMDTGKKTDEQGATSEHIAEWCQLDFNELCAKDCKGRNICKISKVDVRI